MIWLAAASAAATAAVAAPVTGLSSNPKAPIDVTSDQVDVHNTDCAYVYTGSPEALQDTARLRADIMIAHLELNRDGKGAKASKATGGDIGASNSCGEMKTLEAKGHVYYLSSDGRRVHGDNAFYDAATTTLTVTGDVTAVDGQNVMRGSRMVYNTQTGEGHVEGAAKGANAKGRPRMVLYPKDNDQNGQAQAAGGQGAAGDATPAAAKPKKKKSSN
ncbi:MAG: hypothetical protein JSR98_01445 [Proteobacteria bacterium]|nr:hypothetical protein [Pseudomonadota bacterium]